ncbi:glycosyltransferase family 39 protein [Arthrospira platensis NCB002]|nr:glycosyltransferase family 39 protein [Arthrospira platensis NCB002]BAI92426.1 hypothetical protein NIES39_L02670 [Arthrospira platensis NIES-39]
MKLTGNIGETFMRWGRHPGSAWILSMAGLVAIAIMAFLWHLGSVGLVDETEPLFAEAARHMKISGNWITPYFNQETRFDKPPLIYWLIALGYYIFGVNEWAVRWPSALSAIALMVGCFLTLKKFGSTTHKYLKFAEIQPSAWIATALVALNLQTLIWARQGVSDMLLSGCMGLSLFSFFWGYATTKESDNNPAINFVDKLKNCCHWQFPNRWYLGFYIFTGLAVLAKGPVGIVIPGLIVVVFLAYLNRLWSVLPEMGVIWGGIIFGLITVPWYILVIIENGQDYIDSFFGYHNVQRFTSVVNGHSAPWYFYFVVVLIGFLPWSIYLPIAIYRLEFWRRNQWINQPRNQQLGLFAWVWFACIFVFFTIAVTKLPSYVLPLMPAAAILIGIFWGEEFGKNSSYINRKNRWFFNTVLVNILFLVVLAIAIIYSPQFIGPDPAVEDLASVVNNSGLPIKGGIIWTATAVLIAWLIGDRHQWRLIITANLIGFILFFNMVFIPGLFLVDEYRQIPLKNIAQNLATFQQPQEELWMIGFAKPTVVFYSQQPVHFFRINDFFRAEGEPLLHILNVLQNTSESPTALVVSRAKDLARIGLQPGDYPILTKQGNYQLVRISKQILLYRVIHNE